MFTKKNIFYLVGLAGFGFFMGLLVLFSNISPARVASKVFDKLNFTHLNQKTLLKKTLNEYFFAWEKAEPEKMYYFLSAEDRAATALAEYQDQYEEFPVRPVKHKISSISINGNEAQAVILAFWPDFATGKESARKEQFYLIREGKLWKIKEAVSLEK
jgi:hypothetical protein